tara:strand:- start:201 stop:503 length:303 start_codon:yes stop_codon:yes gene_type:complete
LAKNGREPERCSGFRYKSIWSNNLVFRSELSQKTKANFNIADWGRSVCIFCDLDDVCSLAQNRLRKTDTQKAMAFLAGREQLINRKQTLQTCVKSEVQSL